MTCNFNLSVAARTLVCADPSLRYTSVLLELSTTNMQKQFSILPLPYFRRLHPPPPLPSLSLSLSNYEKIHGARGNRIQLWSCGDKRLNHWAKEDVLKAKAGSVITIWSPVQLFHNPPAGAASTRRRRTTGTWLSDVTYRSCITDFHDARARARAPEAVQAMSGKTSVKRPGSSRRRGYLSCPD